MKSSFCIDLQRFMLIPTKFPLSPYHCGEPTICRYTKGYNTPTADIHVALSFGSGFKLARFEDSKITFHKRPLPVNIHPTSQPFKGYLWDGAKIRIVIYICKFLDENVSLSGIKKTLRHPRQQSQWHIRRVLMTCCQRGNRLSMGGYLVNAQNLPLPWGMKPHIRGNRSPRRGGFFGMCHIPDM